MTTMTQSLPTTECTSTSPPAPGESLYVGDAYLQLTNGTWHLEDAAFKARYVDKLVTGNGTMPTTIGEIGCGAGGILAELQEKWPSTCQFTGYEISPQAHELSRQFSGPRLEFQRGDAFTDSRFYDLVMVMDVVEHVEDCFGFMRRVREKGRRQIYHFPLEITCTSAIRDLFGRGFALGHIHHFSLSSALAALEYTGHKIVDWCYTPVGFERAKLPRTRFANLFRRMLPTPLAARLLGGFSLMVLCECAWGMNST